MSKGGDAPSSVTVSYNVYYAGMHMVPCLWARESHLYEIQVNDVTIFEGDQQGSATIYIDKVDIFGGRDGEGGVRGNFTVMDGDPTQSPNPYLQGVIGEVPAYRGVYSIVVEQAALQARNPFLKRHKQKIGCFHGDWYLTKLKIEKLETYTRYETVEVIENIEETPTLQTCTHQDWWNGFCTIPGYPRPPEAIEQGPPNPPTDRDRWTCGYPLYSQGLTGVCDIWKYTGPVASTTRQKVNYEQQAVEDVRTIPLGMNPAHIVREVCVNREVGKGLLPQRLDEASFIAAADTLYDEEFAMSIAWTTQTSINQFIQLVMDHIGGVFVRRPSTGLYELNLLRPGQLPTHDISASQVVRFELYEQSGWAGAVNELTVKYVDIKDGKTKSVTVHDLAAIQRQGTIISETREYLGLPTIELAERVARRDLAFGTTPVDRIRIVVDRSSYNVAPGDLITVTWPYYNLENARFRVADIDYGTQRSNEITIAAATDIYLNDVPASLLEHPTPLPTTIAATNANPRAIHEAPYWYIDRLRQLSNRLDDVLDSDSYLMAIGGRPQESATHFISRFQRNLDEPQYAMNGRWCGSMVTLYPIDELATNFAMDRTYFKEIQRFVPGVLAILGGIEVVEIVNFDTTTWRMTVNRGMLDTVPVAHRSEVTLNTIDLADLAFSYQIWSPGDQATAWLLTATSRGTLRVADTYPVVRQIVGARQGRPLPPGGLTISGTYLGDLFTGDLTLGWSNRNRLTQTTNDHIKQSDPNLTPETGTSIVIKIFGDDNTELREVTLSGDPLEETYTYLSADEIADGGKLNARMRVQVKAVRDGFDSWTVWDHTTFRALRSEPLPVVNGDFATGDLTGWTTILGAPIARPVSELGFPSCGGSAFAAGNDAVNPNDTWSIEQEFDLEDQVSPAAIADGLIIVEFQVYHRTQITGAVGALGVAFFDDNNDFMDLVFGNRFLVSEGAWGVERVLIPQIPGGRFVRIHVQMTGEGGQNWGYVGCITANIHGRLVDPLQVTALTPVVINQELPVRATALTPVAIVPRDQLL